MDIKASHFISLILFIEALVIYFFAPATYNYDFSLLCAVQYLINIGIFFILKKKKNYLDFDSIFFTSYFFVTLFYPVFMYESDPTRFFAFQYDFNPNVMPKASALSLLGISSYIFGSFLYIKPLHYKAKYPLNTFIPNGHLSYAAGFLFILFIISGGYTALKNAYSGEVSNGSGIANYIFIFLPAFVISALVLEFNNLKTFNPTDFKLKYLNKTTLFFTAAIVFLIIITGSRTFPMQAILLVAGLFTHLYKPISFPRFILLALVGMTFMFFLVLLRGYQQDGTFSVVDVAMDLIINNRNSYVAIDYVNTHGLTYGVSMLSSLLAPVPFLQNIVVSLLGVDPSEMASSLVITKITFGEVGSLGLGTNIIADIYLAMGATGVVILMGALGFFVSIVLKNARNNIYALVCYGVMISYAVFLVRAEYFFFLRYLLWSLVIVYLSRLYRIKFVLYKD